MKQLHAFVACSLLGCVWLSACGSSSKKGGTRPTANDAGAAGQAEGGSAGSVVTPGGAAGALEGGAAGASGEAGAVGGASGEGGSGGEGGALACFSEPAWFGGAGAADGVTGEPNETGGVHVGVSCDALKERFTVAYDVIVKQITLDLASVAPVRKATYTFDYSSFNGETYDTGCNDIIAEPVGSKLVISVAEIPNLQQFRLTALQLEDECGGNLILDNQGESGTCFNLTVHNNGEGGDWNVDCYEGSCIPACSVPGA